MIHTDPKKEGLEDPSLKQSEGTDTPKIQILMSNDQNEGFKKSTINTVKSTKLIVNPSKMPFIRK